MAPKGNPDTAFAEIAENLHGFTSSGLVVEITKAFQEMGPGSLALVAAIYKDDVEVGRFSRTLLDLDGRWRAFHMRFDIDPPARGGSFRKDFFHHAEATYRAHGIDDIRVSAEEIGSYLWAKEGFRFMGDEESQRTAEIELWETRGSSLAEQAVKRGDLPELVYEQIEETFAAIRAGTQKPLKPAELADLGSGHTWTSAGHPVWLGKAMLIGWSWNGIKDL